MGLPRKPFSELGEKQKKRRIEEAVRADCMRDPTIQNNTVATTIQNNTVAVDPVEFEQAYGVEVLMGEGQNPQRGLHNPQVCCPECRAEWKQDVETILRRLHEILARDNAQPARQGDNYPLLPSLPFTELEALQQFDRDIQENAEMRAQFIAKLTSIGGKTVPNTIKFAMETVMDDTLSQQVVWILGPAQKPKLSAYTFPKLIVQIVRTTFKETKINYIEAKIAEWLRRGGDRLKAAEKHRVRE